MNMVRNLRIPILLKADDLKIYCHVESPEHLYAFAKRLNSYVSGFIKLTLNGVIRVTKDFNDLATVKMLYNTYVRSRLEYTSTLWFLGYQVYFDSL